MTAIFKVLLALLSLVALSYAAIEYCDTNIIHKIQKYPHPKNLLKQKSGKSFWVVLADGGRKGGREETLAVQITIGPFKEDKTAVVTLVKFFGSERNKTAISTFKDCQGYIEPKSRDRRIYVFQCSAHLFAAYRCLPDKSIETKKAASFQVWAPLEMDASNKYIQKELDFCTANVINIDPLIKWVVRNHPPVAKKGV